MVERTINVQGEDREVFEWTFEVATANDDGTPGDPIEVNGLSSRMTGPQSKTAAYLVALRLHLAPDGLDAPAPAAARKRLLFARGLVEHGRLSDGAPAGPLYAPPGPDGCTWALVKPGDTSFPRASMRASAGPV